MNPAEYTAGEPAAAGLAPLRDSATDEQASNIYSGWRYAEVTAAEGKSAGGTAES